MSSLFFNVTNYIIYSTVLLCVIWYLSQKTNNIIVKTIGWQHYTIICSIGTFFHEISHAAVAFLFGHKIEHFKPFHFNKKTGILGCVTTRYNQDNFIQALGVFFMALAPLVIGVGIIFWLFNLMVPNAPEIMRIIQLMAKNTKTFSIESLYENGKHLLCILSNLFGSKQNIFSISFWCYQLVSFLIASQMVPSGQDLKNMIPGVVGGGILLTGLGMLPVLPVVEHYILWCGHIFSWFLMFTSVLITLAYIVVTIGSVVTSLFRRKFVCSY